MRGEVIITALRVIPTLELMRFIDVRADAHRPGAHGITAAARDCPHGHGRHHAVDRELSVADRAAAGDAEAQFTLGKNYEAGRGGLKKDYAEASRWYQKSADQGNIYAQASLGILYHSGKGVPEDNVQSEMWLILAADRSPQGDRDTIVKMRDSVGAHLTPEQMAEAQRLAREWKRK